MNTVIRKCFNNGTMILAVWLLAGGLCLGADFKSAELQRKAEEIAALRIKISDKLDRAEQMRLQLEDLADDYAEEIRHEKNRWRLASYRTAVANPRIAYDLKLLQQLQAYITELDKRIAYFRQAARVLEYFLRQINDDLMMIRTLDDFTVDQLITRINDALDEFVPETNRKTVRVDRLVPQDAEIIWQEVVSRPKS